MALHDLLSVPRLRFGDADQIEALFILRIAEELLETLRVCPDCDGDGEIETDGHGECSHCGRECPYCSSETEFEECSKCKSVGKITWSRDEVYALSAARIVELLAEARKLAA